MKPPGVGVVGRMGETIFSGTKGNPRWQRLNLRPEDRRNPQTGLPPRMIFMRVVVFLRSRLVKSALRPRKCTRKPRFLVDCRTGFRQAFPLMTQMRKTGMARILAAQSNPLRVRPHLSLVPHFCIHRQMARRGTIGNFVLSQAGITAGFLSSCADLGRAITGIFGQHYLV